MKFSKANKRRALEILKITIKILLPNLESVVNEKPGFRMLTLTTPIFLFAV